MKQHSFLTALCLLFAAVPITGQTIKSSMEFAPSEHWVKPVEKPYREEICLNGTWAFAPVQLPVGFKEGETPAPALPGVNEVTFSKTPIRIPSPWNVNSFADKNGSGGDHRTYPSYPKEWESIKMGWLQKKFTVPASWKGKRIQIHFEAVAGKTDIYVNGKAVGDNFDIFMPFDIDITDAVKFGQENTLNVGIQKSSLFDDRKSPLGRRTYQGGSFWGQHIAGIWQDVYLVALPQTRVADVYIQPIVNKNTLEVEVTLRNDENKPVEVNISAAAYPWISKAGKTVLTAANPSSQLGSQAALQMPTQKVTIPAGKEIKTTLKTTVDNKLKLWSPSSPNLYGLVVKTSVNGKTNDSKYTRFGWRQTELKDGKFWLNGKPFVLKGDSWHYMGIPQMTRRYPWAWYTALRDANCNAVRLHAQPFPSFYLDVADEMGILVLDESAMWASDGGQKLGSEEFWKCSEEHMKQLVLRDRNHPSVFGWSVSNEIMPIIRGVMRNAPGLEDNLVKHFKIWSDICFKYDPSRAWASADGEDDGRGLLPFYMVHYGGEGAMKRAYESGKPWGVGEACNAYYGTPEQVSNAAKDGGRAYRSFEGRMESVAVDAYNSLANQRKYNASYRSVFNLIWYGLQPLPLGLKDQTKAPTLKDGIAFTSFVEGKPGVQPERIGPYSTTVNPGYDPSLPLYKTWPMFDAIKAANAEPMQPCKWVVKNVTPAKAANVKKVKSIKILPENGKLSSELFRTGIPVKKMDTETVPELLIIDGANIPANATSVMQKVYAKGGTVVVWGADPKKVNELNKILPSPVVITDRKATSLVFGTPDDITSGLTEADLYFSELHPAEFTTVGLGGSLVKNSTTLLKACDTDWTKWNKQPEYAKTGMILRTEKESKPEGVVMLKKKMGQGNLVVTTIPAAPRGAKAEKAVRALLTNMGIELGSGSDSGKPLLKSGEIVRVLMSGSYPVASVKEAGKVNRVDLSKADGIKENTMLDGKAWKKYHSQSGLIDFKQAKLDGPTQNAETYMSFWVFSPRPLDDLLIEPNMPVVDLEVAADDAVQVWLNGKMIISNLREGPIEGGKAVSKGLPLHQGWNHFLIKAIQGGGGWFFNGRLICNQPDYLAEEMDSVLEKP